MSSQLKTYVKFGGATVAILLLLAYLAYTGVQDSKSYYVTIKELHKMGDGAYTKRLRVAGNVQPGSIKRVGTHVQFVLAGTACSMPSNSRPSVHRSMLQSSRERLRRRRQPRV